MPENGVLSIRAGGTRRQVQLSAYDRPLSFPCGPEEIPSFKVDALDLVGSARLAYTPGETTYNLELDPTSSLYEKVEVSFNIRRRALGASRQSMDSDAAHSPEPRRMQTEEDRVLDLRREQSAREYLETHGLTTFMQFLMQSLMKDKPGDPYAFLQKQVTKRMVAGSSRQVGAAMSSGVESLIASQTVSPQACTVAPDQLLKLERDAAEASAQLTEDNRKLREMTGQLRMRYEQLMSPHEPAPEEEEARADPPAVPTMLPPHFQAYHDIAKLQDDITSLAKENSSLVVELSQMRSALDAVSKEIVHTAATEGIA